MLSPYTALLPAHRASPVTVRHYGRRRRHTHLVTNGYGYLLSCRQHVSHFVIRSGSIKCSPRSFAIVCRLTPVIAHSAHTHDTRSSMPVWQIVTITSATLAHEWMTILSVIGYWYHAINCQVWYGYYWGHRLENYHGWLHIVAGHLLAQYYRRLFRRSLLALVKACRMNVWFVNMAGGL